MRLFLWLALFMAAVQVIRFAKAKSWRSVFMLLFWSALAGYTLTRNPMLMFVMASALILGFLSKSGKVSSLKSLPEDCPAMSPELKELTVDSLPDKSDTAGSVAEPADVSFSIPQQIEVRLGTRKVLSLRVGDYIGELSLHCESEAEEPEGGSRVECDFVFAHEGRRWRSHTRLWLSRCLSLEDGGLEQHARFWTDAPAEWKEAFHVRCILKGAWLFDDSRIGFPFRIGDRTYTIWTKYLTWRVDLAVSTDGRRLFARMYGLTGQEKDEDEEVPTFCTELPIEKILPLTSPTMHSPADAEMDEEEENEPVEFEEIR